MKKTAVFLFALWMFIFSSNARSQEQRTFETISVPQTQKKAGEESSLSKDEIYRIVETIVKSWNTETFAAHLSPSFYEKDRLLSALATKIPRDAALRLLSVQEIKVLQQETVSGGKGKAFTVSAVIQTSLEFEDPIAGFQKLTGTNRLILKITKGKKK